MYQGRELYGTLFACWLSITFGFFILFMTGEGGYPHPYFATILKLLHFPLGQAFLVMIVLSASVLPTRVFFHIYDKLNSSFCTDALVIVLGSFPFFMAHCVAATLLYVVGQPFSQNIAYAITYFFGFLILMLGRATIDRWMYFAVGLLKKSMCKIFAKIFAQIEEFSDC